MRSVVTGGTGVGAAVPGVKVAGKTGTAELRSTVSEDPTPEPGAPPPEEDTTDTDAWFTAFAPLRQARAWPSACLLVGQGAGGDDRCARRQAGDRGGLLGVSRSF